MKLAIKLYSTTSINANQDNRNVMGDEMIARGWCKYLAREHNVDVSLYQQGDQPRDDIDAVVHFNLLADPWPNVKNVLYMQNAFPPESWPGGTLGTFDLHKDKFDHFIYTSERLRTNCGPDGAVVPFAVDTEIYRPVEPEDRLAHPTCFVGNGIRSADVNLQYLAPAVPFGLHIYGNPIGWSAEFNDCLRGKISQEDEVILYSSSKVCLNCHLGEHLKHDTLNYRVYCILACKGVVLSDRIDCLKDGFSDFVTVTDGYEDMHRKLADILESDTSLIREHGCEFVRKMHTFSQRSEVVYDFLRSVL
jgi:spore maturation protein CgeB